MVAGVLAKDTASDPAQGPTDGGGSYVDPYPPYYYGYCEVQDASLEVFSCPAPTADDPSPSLKIVPSLASLGGPDGPDPIRGYIQMEDLEKDSRCDITVAPKNVDKGINVRIRSLCFDGYSDGDQIYMNGEGGSEAAMDGNYKGSAPEDGDAYVSMGSKATISYRAADKKSSKKDKKNKKDKKDKKDGKKNQNGRKMLQDAAQEDTNKWILEYSVEPGCTPVDYYAKRRACYSSSTVNVTGYAGSSGFLTAEGPWAADCAWEFLDVPKGYTVDLQVECLAAGMGTVTLEGKNGKSLTISDFASFLECDKDGCGLSDAGAAPKVSFTLASSVNTGPVYDSNGQAKSADGSPYYYYYSYITSVAIKYSIVPIPGQPLPEPEPAYPLPAPPKGARVFECTNQTVYYYYVYDAYDGYYDDTTSSGKRQGRKLLQSRDDKYQMGTYLYGYFDQPEEFYIYYPTYAANSSCSGFFSASSAGFEGTFDLTVVGLDTERDVDYLSVYGSAGQYQMLTGDVDPAKPVTLTDVGNTVSFSFYSDASIERAGFLIKATVRASDRCPYPSSWGAKAFYCYGDYMSNTTDIRVKAAAGAKGSFVVSNSAPPTCNFNLDWVPAGYEVQARVTCLAADAGTVRVFDADGRRVGSAEDTPFNSSTTVYTLGQGSRVTFASNYGGYQNVTYSYTYYYGDYYNGEKERSDPATGVKVAGRRLMQDADGSYGGSAGSGSGSTGDGWYTYTGWYLTPVNSYPYYTPQLLVDYRVVPKDGFVPEEPEDRAGACKAEPKGALDLSPAASDDYEFAELGDQKCNKQTGECSGNYGYLYKSSSYAYAYLPVEVPAPFAADSAPEGYILLRKYKPNFSATASLSLVSQNPLTPLSNETTLEITVVCLDSEEDTDYLTIMGSSPNQNYYYDYYRNYVTLSGVQSGLAYDSMGSNVYISFYADDSVEYTGFLIKWRVVKDTSDADGGSEGDASDPSQPPKMPARTREAMKALKRTRKGRAGLRQKKARKVAVDL